jgi:adenine deaminase
MGLMEKRMAAYDALLAAARGDIQVDLLIRGGKILNMFTGELLQGDVAIHQGFIVSLFGKNGKAKETLDATGLIVAPAYIDPHVHIESSMVLPPVYAETVAAQGTGTVLADPHEIVNVMGVPGFKLMADNAHDLPLRLFFDAPTCVPSKRSVESCGADIRAPEIEQMVKMGARKLGELMSFDEIVAGDPVMTEIVKTGWNLKIPRDAHFPLIDDLASVFTNLNPWDKAKVFGAILGAQVLKLRGLNTAALQTLIPRLRAIDHTAINAYLVALGLTADHETYGPEIQIKLDYGMRLMLSSHIFSMGPTYPLLLAVVKKLRYKDSIGLCTDDIWPDDLVKKGGLAGVLRDLVANGIDAVDAIRFATFNIAQRLTLAGIPEAVLLGAVSPGMAADLVLLHEPLKNFEPAYVLHEGKVVAKEGRIIQPTYESEIPPQAVDSVQLPELQTEMFKIPANGVQNGKVRVRVLRVPKPPALPFPSMIEDELPVKDGFVDTTGAMVIAVFNRYGKFTGKPVLGIVKGFNLKMGAVASTVAHDSHNLVVLGMNIADMVQAARRVIAMHGGLTAVLDGKLLAEIPLPVGGLMSTQPIGEVAESVRSFREAFALLGLDPKSPIIPFAAFTLPAGPGAKVTDLGVWDNEKKEFVPLVF